MDDLKIDIMSFLSNFEDDEELNFLAKRNGDCEDGEFQADADISPESQALSNTPLSICLDLILISSLVIFLSLGPLLLFSVSLIFEIFSPSKTGVTSCIELPSADGTIFCDWNWGSGCSSFDFLIFGREIVKIPFGSLPFLRCSSMLSRSIWWPLLSEAEISSTLKLGSSSSFFFLCKSNEYDKKNGRAQNGTQTYLFISRSKFSSKKVSREPQRKFILGEE